MRNAVGAAILAITILDLSLSGSAMSRRADRYGLLAAEAQSASCESARELLAKAKERAAPGADRGRLQEALDLVKLALRQCPTLGDAFYYAALIATELGDATNAAYYRQRAEQLGSEALRQGRDLAGQSGSAAIAEPPMRVSAVVRKRLALVIGISRFKDPNINPLRFTANDARAMAASLSTVSKFDYVKSLVDDEATAYNVKTEINRLARMAEPEDLVVLYFSSHGSPENLDTAGINYIVTFDTEVNNLYATAYKMDDLMEDIGRRIKAERVVAFLDTCYSGGTFRSVPANWAVSSRALVAEGAPQTTRMESRLKAGSRVITVEPSERSVNRIAQGIGRVVITSSSQNERSWEDEQLQHGYFTYFLLEGIKEKTPVSVEDLYDYVKRRVSDAVTREKNQPQHPNIARNRSRVDVYLRDEIVPGAAKK
jgi:uncharacterized caspase-like protein